jgi:hypothetical protein
MFASSRRSWGAPAVGYLDPHTWGRHKEQPPPGPTAQCNQSPASRTAPTVEAPAGPRPLTFCKHEFQHILEQDHHPDLLDQPMGPLDQLHKAPSPLPPEPPQRWRRLLDQDPWTFCKHEFQHVLEQDHHLDLLAQRMGPLDHLQTPTIDCSNHRTSATHIKTPGTHGPPVPSERNRQDHWTNLQSTTRGCSKSQNLAALTKTIWRNKMRRYSFSRAIFWLSGD